MFVRCCCSLYYHRIREFVFLLLWFVLLYSLSFNNWFLILRLLYLFAIILILLFFCTFVFLPFMNYFKFIFLKLRSIENNLFTFVYVFFYLNHILQDCWFELSNKSFTKFAPTCTPKSIKVIDFLARSMWSLSGR